MQVWYLDEMNLEGAKLNGMTAGLFSTQFFLKIFIQYVSLNLQERVLIEVFFQDYLTK